MGMYDSFRTTFEGKTHLAQSKAFACVLQSWRIGDEVAGNSPAIYRGASAHIESTNGEGVPPWVVLLIHDSIYVDFGWAMDEVNARRMARELVDRRFGLALAQAESWKATLARVVGERNRYKDIKAEIVGLLSAYAEFRADPKRYQASRESPLGALRRLPDFQERDFFERVRDVLGDEPGDE